MVYFDVLVCTCLLCDALMLPRSVLSVLVLVLMRTGLSSGICQVREKDREYYTFKPHWDDSGAARYPQGQIHEERIGDIANINMEPCCSLMSKNGCPGSTESCPV